MRGFYKLKLTLLTPLFYWSKISPGATFTDDFIGDLALYYAVNRVLGIKNVTPSFHGKFTPNYEEIKDLGFWISCARPINTSVTGFMSHKTEFKAEVVNTTPKLEEASGKSPYKGWFRQQGIEALSEFEVIIYCDKKNIPNAIRVGTHLNTLVSIEVQPFVENNDVLLNLYSWQKIYKLPVDLSNGYIEYKLPIYMTYLTPLTKENQDAIVSIFN